MQRRLRRHRDAAARGSSFDPLGERRPDAGSVGGSQQASAKIVVGEHFGDEREHSEVFRVVGVARDEEDQELGHRPMIRRRESDWTFRARVHGYDFGDAFDAGMREREAVAEGGRRRDRALFPAGKALEALRP